MESTAAVLMTGGGGGGVIMADALALIQDGADTVMARKSREGTAMTARLSGGSADERCGDGDDVDVRGGVAMAGPMG